MEFPHEGRILPLGETDDLCTRQLIGDQFPPLTRAQPIEISVGVDEIRLVRPQMTPVGIVGALMEKAADIMRTTITSSAAQWF